MCADHLYNCVRMCVTAMLSNGITHSLTLIIYKSGVLFALSVCKSSANNTLLFNDMQHFLREISVVYYMNTSFTSNTFFPFSIGY